MPKAKPKKVEYYKERSFTPEGKSVPVTLYSFNVEMEDGTKGVYEAKDKDKPKFRVGEEIEYEVIVKKGTSKKTGKDYEFNKLKPVSHFGGGGYKRTPEDRKRSARRASLDVAVQFLAGKQVKNTEHLSPLWNKFYLWLVEDVDSDDNSKDRTTALYAAFHVCEAGMAELSSDQVLKVADGFIDELKNIG